MTEPKQKILVSGDVKGKFKTLFSRVSTINDKSGPFDMLLCVGDFFGDSASTWQPYQTGAVKVPVPTYVLGPTKAAHMEYYPDMNGGELCPNVYYLGKRGILTSCGLRLAYMSGMQGAGDEKFRVDEKDATAVRDIALKCEDFQGVDVLLTSQWPKGIKDEVTEGSEHLAWLACQLRPRYHFAGLAGTYYERPPYANHPVTDGIPIHCSRFIALAEVGNAQKHKWIYAANLTPIGNMKYKELHQATSDQTECPYPRQFAQFNRSAPSESAGRQYFYDMNPPDDRPDKRKRGNHGDEGRKKMNFDQGSCWFCLASPAVQKHLVISIGETVYLALARGGLNEHHVMVLPIQHHQSTVVLTDEVRSEIKKFKSSLRKYFKTKQLVPVYYERNYKTSHLQLQVVPVPRGAPVKEAFLAGAEEHGLELSELPHHSKLEDMVQPGTPFFYVELPSKERLFCSCRKNFPIMFGRDVLVSESVLNLPHKVDWKDCTLSKEKEQEVVQTFRSEFKEFDFTN